MLACLALLGVAAWLDPAPEGLGTHRQLGLQSCQWLGDRGYACPSCGMTTAFALAANGRLLAALWVQPAGALGALGVAMVAWLAGFSLFTGQSLMPVFRPLWQWRMGLIAGAGILAAWGFKLVTG